MLADLRLTTYAPDNDLNGPDPTVVRALFAAPPPDSGLAFVVVVHLLRSAKPLDRRMAIGPDAKNAGASAYGVESDLYRVSELLLVIGQSGGAFPGYGLT